jgi:hypothetical protein
MIKDMKRMHESGRSMHDIPKYGSNIPFKKDA